MDGIIHGGVVMENEQDKHIRVDEKKADISVKKSIAIATVAVSLGLSLGVPVGSVFAANENQSDLHPNNHFSNQLKHSNQIKGLNQGKFSNQIKDSNQGKFSNQIKGSNQGKFSN
jgi:hypothetical protein